MAWTSTVIVGRFQDVASAGKTLAVLLITVVHSELGARSKCVV